MPRFTIQTRKWLGTWLVVLQLGLLILQAALAALSVLQGIIPLATWLMAGASIALAAWALGHNKLGNFNVRPTPKANGVLVTSGPYRWIRHPMYTSLLLGSGALAWMSDPVMGWLTWFALAIVLLLKSMLEEHWLREQYPGYAAYRRTSKRLLPWLF